jgi:hypothetical protein
MLRIIKHIILVGDSSRHLIALQHRIREIAPGMEPHIADIRGIPEVLQRQRVDMILIYVHDDQAGFPYIQRIRQERLADRIPVFVCREPLEEAPLNELLKGATY